MYMNKLKLATSITLWSLPAFLGMMGVIVLGGMMLTGDAFKELLPFLIVFLPCFVVSAVICYIYLFKGINYTRIALINNLLVADEDGYVPIKDLCKGTGSSEEKIIKTINYGIRKGFLINLNLNMSEKAIYLSDKIKPAQPLMGRPEDKPFIGLHCPGCAASLKIRANTKGTCPYCGREIISPSIEQ